MTEKALSPHPKIPPVGSVDKTGKPTGIPLEWERWFATIAGELVKQRVYDVGISPGSVSANSTKTVVAAVPGARMFHAVTVSRLGAVSGVGISNAWVSAADQVTVEFFNVTAGSLDPGARQYRIYLV